MNRWSRVFSVVVISSTLTGCLWRKKPKAVQAPPPPPVQHPSATRRPAAKPRPAPEKPTPEKKAASPTAPLPPAKQVSTKPAASLGQMLSPAERTQLTQAVNESLSSVRRNLAILSSRALTADQAEQRKIIEAFVLQAERARQRDLTTAAHLAHRAEVLAQALAGINR